MRETLEGLYDQFVGRDLFAKIGPGAILLASVAWCLDYNPSEASIGDWTFAMILSWLAGLGIQSFGEWCGLLLYYPARDEDGSTLDNRSWHDKVGEMMELPNYKEKYQLGYERLIVIKEASGVAYIALILASLIVSYRLALDYITSSYTPAWLRDIPAAVILVAMVVLLGRMHFAHVERQNRYVNRVLKRTSRHGSAVGLKS